MSAFPSRNGFVMVVRVAPGLTAFTRMPSRPSSTAAVRTRLETAAFEAQ